MIDFKMTSFAVQQSDPKPNQRSGCGVSVGVSRNGCGICVGVSRSRCGDVWFSNSETDIAF